MKKTLVFVILAVFASGFLKAVEFPANDSVLGKWNFESKQAPYGYEKGSILITEEEGVLAGEIRFADGVKVPMKNVSFEEGVLKFSINVEYNTIPVKATIEGNKMKGAASTPEGEMPFEAKKAETIE